MHILYFAWLRERTGKNSEELTLPANIGTPRELIAHLRGLGPGYAAAFADEKLIRCAVDQEFHALDAPFAEAREIAFFPPVTGG
ncbi:molybdopterin converting factor subunit 1 [Acidocella sp.]|uniref:molybdopterin converting factor subunit 1 n=1 Tax=Acidocella sp. TaxID=50710 RepID=UPI003CFC8104